MFTYHIAEGRLTHPAIGVAANGYSGRGVGLNNPECTEKGYTDCTDAGPITQGRYTITGTEDSHGGFAIVLEPDADTRDLIAAQGRSGGYLMHGDMVSGPPHMASEGCIIIPRLARWAVWGSGDRELDVIS